MFDIERFHEVAGFFEYDEGMTRFQAETHAAERIGCKRHEVINEIRRRNSQDGGNIRQASARQPAGDMPGVQSHPAEEGGPVSVGDVQAGRDRLALLALSAQRRGVLR